MVAGQEAKKIKINKKAILNTKSSRYIYPKTKKPTSNPSRYRDWTFFYYINGLVCMYVSTDILSVPRG